MKFQAEINVMPLKEILDPQGKAVTGSMKNIGLAEVQNVRIGKHITLEIEAENAQAASEKVELACKKLLANLIMESYDFSIKEI
jgi:phosphoribosylformylglycinamidine synthase PurS subunit